MSRSNFFFLFFFFFFSPTKIYISSTRVFLRSKKYTTNTNVIELGRRERERERKVERSPLSIIFFHQLILNGTRSISSATVAIPGIELAPRRALVTSRPKRCKAREILSSFPFFFFHFARIFRISTCFTASGNGRSSAMLESLLERGANVLSILSSPNVRLRWKIYFSGRESSCDPVAPLRLKPIRVSLNQRWTEQPSWREERRKRTRTRCVSFPRQVR